MGRGSACDMNRLTTLHAQLFHSAHDHVSMKLTSGTDVGLLRSREGEGTCHSNSKHECARQAVRRGITIPNRRMIEPERVLYQAGSLVSITYMRTCSRSVRSHYLCSRSERKKARKRRGLGHASSACYAHLNDTVSGYIHTYVEYVRSVHAFTTTSEKYEGDGVAPFST